MGIFKINKDFKVFKSEVNWFLSPDSKIEFQKQKEIRLSEEFKGTFPNLTKLILKSRATFLSIDTINYILFAWDTLDGKVCGWLNQQEAEQEFKCELIQEHHLLLQNIGGIRESFNPPENSCSNNQNFMFIASECSRGIGDYVNYYPTMCEEEGKHQIDYSTLLAFANEANGALTMYDPKTKKVFLFSHDHCFENVEFMENQPEYTFHTFKKVVIFEDYVEDLAKEWIEIIK
ncbi:hypothetical protein [Croceimicrobium hydrocarbonivorans]|uniref:Uncharacterized protein n=1 Tax=Croceimicrobium hydrocarbonivorans TaxID=2761580 RepID=A0A7H0VHE3_9FLAO|nr:hypothetical protein [Croceimicrobium hydrocarbonivorans]QNR25141.1 hypothetical protein H4K34_04700 [Croceimicrobium hydrocarbonivorans]